MRKIHSSAKALIYAVAAILCVLCTTASYAQRVNEMTVTTWTGGYSTISASKGTTYLGNGCDMSNPSCGTYYYAYVNTNLGYPMALPFNFKYDNVSYTAGATIWVHFGHVSFSQISPNYQDIITPAQPAYHNAIVALSGLQTTNGTSGYGVYYNVAGASPNRVFTIEWYKMGDYPSQSLGNCSYQIKLYETSNMIEFIYEKYGFQMNNTSYASYTKGTGLNGLATPSFLQVKLMTSSQYTPNNNYRFSTQPNTQLSTSPKILIFGQQLQGTTVDLTATVKNVGTEGLLNITSATITGTNASDFTILSPATPPQNIPLDGTATYTIRYTAQSFGPRSASLVINSNGRDSGSQSIGLSAYSIAPEINATPTILFKGVRKKLGESVDQSIAITSMSQASLFFINYPNSFTFTGDDASDFTIVRLPQNPIPGGVTDTLTVRFTPKVEGARQVTMRINTNANNIPSLPISLRGLGILPHIVVTPETMHFDSVSMGETVTKKFTIYNPGSDTLILNQNFFSSADQDFTLTPLTGTDAIIPPERSREVNVTFRPLQRGTRSARYRIMTNIPFTFEQVRRDTATNSLYYDITGTGVPVGTLTMDVTDDGILDSSIIGVEKCRQVVITNSGDADVSLTSAMFTGTSAGDYEVNGITYPYLLKAKSTVSVQVCGTPADRGSRLATMLLTGTSGDKTILVSSPVDILGLKACAEALPSVAFENSVILNTTMDSAMVTVTNCGDVATTYTPTITGPDAAMYSVTPATFGPVAAGGTASFWVYFTPTSRGAKTATLTLAGENVASMTVALSGQGACAVPEATATVAAPKTQTGLINPIIFPVTINNSGNAAWNVGTPTVTGDAAFAYVAAGSDAVIPANGSGIINVSFHPSIAGTVNAQLTFPGSGPCAENELTVNIAGEGFVDAGVRDIRTVDGYILEQNTPNPTNGSTSFNYTVPSSTTVRIVLADVTGKVVRELVSGHVAGGTYQVDVTTTGLASGTYLYIMEAGNARLVRQMAIAK